MKVYNFVLRLMGRRKVYTSEEGVHLPQQYIACKGIVSMYIRVKNVEC